MLKLLSNYDSIDIRTSKMPWTQKEGQNSGKPEPKDKYRFNFTINDGEQALKCFKDFQDPKKVGSKIFAKIFYLKPEQVFE